MQGSAVNLVKSPIDFFRLLRKMTPNLCNPNLGVFVCTCVCVCVRGWEVVLPPVGFSLITQKW